MVKKTKKKSTKRKAPKKRTYKRTRKGTIKKSKKVKKKDVVIAKLKTEIPIEPTQAELEVAKPSSWFRAVQREENVTSSYIWHINKEKIYGEYGKRMYQWWDEEGKPKRSTERPTPNMYGYSSLREILVLPTGKVITPIRQFCETKILPPGTREAFFYDFGKVDYKDVTDMADAPPATPIIRSSGAEADPRGTRIDIGYQQTEESPIDIIASANRAFALESINDENTEVLERAFNMDRGSSGSATERKAKGGGTKEGRWLDNRGNQITTDTHITEDDKLTVRALLGAVEVIQNEGLDTSNVVLYTTGKAIDDLKEDPELVGAGISNMEPITEARLERALGMKIIRSSACPTTAPSMIKKPIKEKYWKRFKRVILFKPQPYKEVENYGGKRSVLFIPNITFGLVCGRDLTMEAQRRNERQVIHLTGTQKTASVVKNVEGAVRISHA